MNPINIKGVHTERKYALAAYGDTNEFSTFVQRTTDDPNVHRLYLLELYKTALAYQSRTRCFIKLLLDGFLVVHEFDEMPKPAIVASIIRELDVAQRSIDAAKERMAHPRPGFFRITCAMGHVWSLTLKTEAPKNCATEMCDSRLIRDYFGYPTILAKRMSESSHRFPMSVCQLIKESLEKTKHPYELKKIPAERRVPSGVFKEDMAARWELRRKILR